MIEPAPNLTAAFARLERRLVRRRLAAIEPILRFEIAALDASISASLFWQSRSRLGSIAFARGPWGLRSCVRPCVGPRNAVRDLRPADARARSSSSPGAHDPAGRRALAPPGRIPRVPEQGRIARATAGAGARAARIAVDLRSA